MKKLLRLCFSLMALLISLVVLIVVLLRMPSINEKLILAVTDMTNGLDIETVKGDVFEQLELTGIRYETETFNLTIEQFSIELAVWELLSSTIHIHRLNLHMVDYQQLLTVDQPRQQQNTVSLAFALQLDKAEMTELSYSNQDRQVQIKKLATALTLSGQDLDIRSLQVEYQQLFAQLSGQIELTKLYPFSLTMDMTGNYENSGLIQSHWKVHGNSEQINFDQSLAMPFALKFHGYVEPEKHLTVDMQGQWKDFQWPLQGNAEVSSHAGQFSVSGSVENYIIQVDSDLQAKELSASQLSVSATANQQKMYLHDLQLQSNPGSVTLQGEVDWADKLRWNFDLNAENLPLEHWQSEVQGQLNVNANIIGHQNPELSLLVNLQSLKGEIQGYPLTGSGVVNYASKRIQIENFQLLAGDNRAIINGVIDNKNNLDVLIDAKDLSIFNSALQGQLYVQGKVTGNQETPKATFKLSVQDFSFQQYSLENLKIDGDVSAGQIPQWELSASAEKIQIDEQILKSTAIQSSGTSKEHKLQIQALTSLADLDLAVRGAYQKQNQRWLGQLDSLHLDNTELGNWESEKATDVDVLLKKSPVQINSSSLCLQQESTSAEICLTGLWKKQEGQYWQASIKQFPLNNLAQFLPDQVEIRGQIEAQMEVSTAKEMNGSFSLQSKGGQLQYQSELTGEQQINFETEAKATLSEKKVNAEWLVDSDNQLHISSLLKIQQWADLEHSQLFGQLKLVVPDLSWLDAFNLPMTEIKGAVNSELEIVGSLAQPVIAALSGEINEMSFNVPQMGSTVTGINIKAKQIQDKHYQISGLAKIDQDSLQLNGLIQPGDNGEVELTMDLKGDHLKIMQLPEAEIWVSPDLNIKLNRSGVNVAGQIDVPEAKLVFVNLPENAIQVSQDEILIPEKKVEPKQMKNIVANVMISLGEAVKIQGFGLSTRIKGDLKAIYNNGRMQLFNELNLLDGVYQSYGQDLRIEKGQLLFNGNIENPGISLLAFRKATASDDDVTAYLRMTGSLKDPKVTIYSVPTKPENEALAYLLTGAPLNKAGGSSSALLASAAMYFGKDYLGTAASVVGIEEVDFKSTSVGDSSLILGKQVLPDLYVRYIMDVLSTQMVVAVEYKLTEQISIEARAGDTHSSDIKYRFEFD